VCVYVCVHVYVCACAKKETEKSRYLKRGVPTPGLSCLHRKDKYMYSTDSFLTPNGISKISCITVTLLPILLGPVFPTIW